MTREQFEAMRRGKLRDLNKELKLAINNPSLDYMITPTASMLDYWQSLTYEDWQADQMIKDNQDLMDDLVKKGD